MSPLGWVVVIASVLVLEGFLTYRIATAFRRGIVQVDPAFWLADWLGFEFDISRERHPISYWLGVLFLMIVFGVVAALFAAIVVAALRGS
jgi:hypothetical protein